MKKRCSEEIEGRYGEKETKPNKKRTEPTAAEEGNFIGSNGTELTTAKSWVRHQCVIRH
jgi:hypothetical protein